MKQFYLKERDALEHSRKNAGSKARNDVETILDKLGFEPVDVVIPYKKVDTISGAVKTTFSNYRFWKQQLSGLGAGDRVLMQFPPRSHSALFPRLIRALRKRGVLVTFLIHDLETMRYKDTSELPLMKRMRIYLEETRLIRTADFIICHNDKMKGYLMSQGLSGSSLIPLGIFDYLTGFDPEAGDVDREPDGERNRVIIAGNLSPEKCVYLTDLGQENVTYMGSFLPDELVGELRGDFGLVWDGTSIETCSGNFGNYLRLNDPHKLSLYLTAGIPVVVWEEAAVADFVRKEHVGVAVASLTELKDKLAALTANDYEEMRQNALRISRLTRSGHYLTTAISRGLQ